MAETSAASLSSGATPAPAFRPLAASAGWSIAEFICDAGPDDRPFEERHDSFSIAAVMDGAFVYHGEIGRTLLHPGALLLGNHRACFQCGHDHGSGDRCISLQIAPDHFSEIAATAAGTSRFRFHVSRLAQTRATVPHFAFLSALRQRAAALPDALALEERVIAMTADILRLLSGHAPARARTSPRDEQRILRVLHHMRAHRSEPLALATLAGMAAMSKFHFARQFRAVTGRTPHQYLLDLRLQQAALALQTSNAAISAIVFDCGFADLSTFNAMFRRAFGMTPRDYRRLHS